MTNAEWIRESIIIKEFLDKIDLESEIIHGELINDFMDRLEEKYPFVTEYSLSLFNCFRFEDFEDYLYERYHKRLTNEIISTYMI